MVKYTKRQREHMKDEATTICLVCEKEVPVTLYCIYCTAPILAELKKK